MGLRPHLATLTRPWAAESGARGAEDYLFFVASEGLGNDQPAEFTAEAQGLALYLRALYAAIFLIGGRQLQRPVLEGMLRSGLAPLRSSADRYLAAFANQQPIGLPEPGWTIDLALLQAACDRTRVSQLLDPSLITLIKAVWGDQPITADEVTVYFPQADGELADGRAVLPPVAIRSVAWRGSGAVTVPFWRWLHAICPVEAAADWSVDGLASVVARAALPLNPRWVLRTDPRAGTDLGIPFANYLAMAMMEALLLNRGEANDLTDPRYDGRRRLQMQMQCRFFGGGGYTICDQRELARFWDERRAGFADAKQSLFGDLIRRAASAAEQTGVELVSLALEALGAGDEAEEDKHPGADELEAATDKAEVGAHDDEEDPTEDLPSEEIADANEGDDDPMVDPTAPPTEGESPTLDNTMLQDAGANRVSNDIDPFTMATMDKGLSAYLFRRGVAAVFTRLSTDPNPAISPSALAMLRYWCNQWLSVASVDATKSLLAKLGLTKTLRPFTRN